MAIAWPKKDPNDILDFGFNFAPLLDDATDVITSITATVEQGGPSLNVVSASVVLLDPQKVVVWLSGGTVGSASVRLRAATALGRTVDQTMSLPIAER